MNDPKLTWACILDLATEIENPASGAGDEEVVALARLVLDFHRDVVKHPLRARDVESQDEAGGVPLAGALD